MNTDWKEIKKKDKKHISSSKNYKVMSTMINSSASFDALTTNTPMENDEKYIKSIRERLQSSSTRTMIILRGPSGCGKSYLAAKIKLNGIVLSTDDFFIDSHGNYKYDIRFINEAHAKNKSKAKDACKDGKTPIIIDNTNIKIWEFEQYIRLALEFEYRIEIVEPNTSWKRNAYELERKNKHLVPMSKIKTQISEFEKCDLSALIKRFKQQQQQKLIQKSSCLNLNILLGDTTKTEWFIPDLDNDITSSSTNTQATTQVCEQSVKNIKSDVSTFDQQTQTNENECQYLGDFMREIDTNPRDINFWIQKSPKKEQSLILKYDKGCSTEEFSEHIMQIEKNEKISLLKSLFPDFTDELIENLLNDHNSDVNAVACMLSESISKDFEPPVTRMNPLSLRLLCENVLNTMDDALKHHFESLDTKSQSEDSEDSSGISLDMNGMIDRDRDISDFDIEDGVSKEPILTFKLDKQFACSLFNLFSTSDERFDENEIELNVDIDYKLASELYECWMRAKKKLDRQQPPPTSTHSLPLTLNSSTNFSELDDFEEDYKKISRQIEEDAQLAMELFEQDNMIDPITGKLVYLNEIDGVNRLSLRQIMAEQHAELKNPSLRNSKKASSPMAPLNRTHIATRSNDPTLAVCIKRRQIYELYERNIDRFTLDKIFNENNFNYNDTCKYIETNYGLREEAMRKEVRMPRSTKSPSPRIAKTLSQVASDLTPNSDGNEYRQMAHKYFQIRQEYYERASEAFARGWGAVAQYYAECGHKQSIYMKKLNTKAAINIFALNNANLDTLNTLDMHGLSCNEALSMFKKVFQKKKADLKYSPRQKSYLYVITGCGRHSFNNKSKLRPTIINYLNRTGIAFKEPNIGLLRVDLM